MQQGILPLSKQKRPSTKPVQEFDSSHSVPLISVRMMLGIVALFVCCAAGSELGSRILIDDTVNQGFMSDLVQKPIFFFGEMRNTELDIGDPCSFSFNCVSGCCLKEKNGKTRCRRKTRKDERCSVGQIKLDLYMDYCPCEQGNKYCSEDPESRCLA